MAISPVPSTRVSDLFVSQRLLAQIQSDQIELFKVQNSISTGRRISVPSEDAPAALRAISLQDLLQRKQQFQTNLATNQSYLTASDSAIQGVSTLLADIRGEALAVADTTSTDVQRRATASQVGRAIQQLLDIANRNFRGRFLFAGSSTDVRPFEQRQDGSIQYHGDEKNLLSYSDVNLLFETNVTGDQVFGAISGDVKGTVDVNPVLERTTKLSDLRGGRGIRLGSIRVSVDTTSSVVDISSAKTIGDVARLLVAHPPAGRTITARVTSTGLTVEADAAGGGNLTISEVGSGTTASELGILNTTGGGTGPIVGADLNPRLTLTTPLANLLGSRATAHLPSGSIKNDLTFEAAANGVQWNGVTINLVDDARYQAANGIAAGSEFAQYHPNATAATAALKFTGANNDLVIQANQPGTGLNNVTVAVTSTLGAGTPVTSYNSLTKVLSINLRSDGSSTGAQVQASINAEGTFTATLDSSVDTGNTGAGATGAPTNLALANTANTGAAAKTLFVHIQPGVTTANQVIAAVNAEGTFTARLDEGEDNNDGSGTILDGFTDPAATAVTSGGSGKVFDQTSGLRVESAGQVHVIDLSPAKTVEDLLNILHGSGIGLLAQINAAGNGLDLRSRLSGTDFTIGENGGTTASDLSLRTLIGTTRLADLNHGLGVHAVGNVDFTIQRKDGVEFGIDVSSAVTVQDVLDRINQNPINLATGAPVVARLSRVGNGIELLNEGPPGGTGNLTVKVANFSQAARDLGLIPIGATSSLSPVAGSVAQGTVVAAGINNDLKFVATGTGTKINGNVVRFQDTGLGAGNSTVTYNALAGTLTFDIDAATTTANQVIGLLNANPTAAALFSASLEPSDGSPNDGTGLVGFPADTTLSGGTAETLTGTDQNPREVKGIFTSLIRLQQALNANDVLGIDRALSLLDDGNLGLNFTRADLGARQQGLDVLSERLDAEQIELKGSLSQEIDVDLAEAISNLTARQAAFEASLRTAGQIYKLSLLDFL